MDKLYDLCAFYLFWGPRLIIPFGCMAMAAAINEDLIPWIKRRRARAVHRRKAG